MLSLQGGDPLMEQHGEGVGFLARTASRNPDAQGLIGLPPGDQIGNGLFRQKIEHLGITEEAGDIDEQVLGEKVKLVAVAPQNVEVAVHVIGLDRRHRHAPLRPAPQRTLLI